MMDDIKFALSLGAGILFIVVQFILLVILCGLIVYDLGGASISDVLQSWSMILRVIAAVLVFFAGIGFIIVVTFNVSDWVEKKFKL